MDYAFPAALRKAIKSAGLTPARFGKLVGSQNYVYSILSGYFPPTGDETKLRSWAEVLKLDEEGVRQLIVAAHLDRAPDSLREEFDRMRRRIAKLERTKKRAGK